MNLPHSEDNNERSDKKDWPHESDVMNSHQEKKDQSGQQKEQRAD